MLDITFWLTLFFGWHYFCYITFILTLLFVWHYFFVNITFCLTLLFGLHYILVYISFLLTLLFGLHYVLVDIGFGWTLFYGWHYFLVDITFWLSLVDIIFLRAKSCSKLFLWDLPSWTLKQFKVAGMEILQNRPCKIHNIASKYFLW